MPSVKDYRFNSFREGDVDAFPVSLNVVLNLARKADLIGKKSQWFMLGGPEREEATELFRLAIRIANNIFQDHEIKLAAIYKEAANQLEERHAERGKQMNSRWNKCAAIKEDLLSTEAR